MAFALRDHSGAFVANEIALTVLEASGLTAARPLARGRMSLASAKALARRRSQYARVRMEGIVIAACGAGPLDCAKYVAPHYVHVARNEMSGTKNTLAS